MEQAFKVPSLVAALLLVGHEGAYLTTYETITIEVQDKNTVFAQDDAADGYTPHNWLVYTPDEVFRVARDWRRGEYRVAERYHALKVGRTYRVEVAGWRVPEINWYRNIVSVEEAVLPRPHASREGQGMAPGRGGSTPPRTEGPAKARIL